METEVKKLFRGHVSVRDYIVESCFKRDQDLVIKYRAKKMTVLQEDLLHHMQFHRHAFKSRYNADQVYELIDFKWKPDPEYAIRVNEDVRVVVEVPPPEQMELFDD